MTRQDWTEIITGLKFFLGFLAIITLVALIVGSVAFLIYVMNRSHNKGKAPKYTVSPVFNVTPDMLEQAHNTLKSGRRSRKIGNSSGRNIDFSEADLEQWSVLGEEDVRTG